MKDKQLTTIAIERKRNDLTQKELAEIIKVSKNSIVNIEKKHNWPCLLTALKIAHHFNLKIEDFKEWQL